MNCLLRRDRFKRPSQTLCPPLAGTNRTNALTWTCVQQRRLQEVFETLSEYAFDEINDSEAAAFLTRTRHSLRREARL